MVQAGLVLGEGVPVLDAKVLLHDARGGVLLAHPEEAQQLLAPGNGGALAAVLDENVLQHFCGDTSGCHVIGTAVLERKHFLSFGKK